MTPYRYSGMKVFVLPDHPKMRLGPGDYVTPAFRAEIDAWLLDFFGTTNFLGDGEVIQTPFGLHMNPHTFYKLKDASKSPDL